MMNLATSLAGAAAAQAAVRGIAGRAVEGMGSGARIGAARSVGIIRGNASGRPGPRVIFGDFRRSITDIVSSSGETMTVSLGSSAPQAARLENPFYGPDSLDRMFPGTTYPWLRPSIGAVTDAMNSAVSDGIRSAL